VVLSIFAKACLFLSSYIPLWAILILFHWGDWGWWLLAPFLALAGGCLGLLILWHWVVTGSQEEVSTAYAMRQDSDSVAYIVTYIFPFLTLVIGSALQALGVFALFLTIMLVYVSSDMLYVNPVLAALGWHAHAIHTKGGTELILLTKRRLIREGPVLHAVRLGDTIWWERDSTGSSTPR
jgi:hypothetical protein